MFVALGAALSLALRDNRHLEPERRVLERLVGASLSDPSYQSSSAAYRSWRWLHLRWTLLTLPPPNSFELTFDGDVWTYTFAADAGFRPPPESPLRVCSELGFGWCTPPGGPWRYYAWTGPDGGQLAAQYAP